MLESNQDEYFGACPLCKGTGTSRKVPYFTGLTPQLVLVRCDSCDLVRTEIAQNYERRVGFDVCAYYGHGKNKFFPCLQRIRNFLARRRATWCMRFVPANVSKPKILDMGCAEGRLLRAFLQIDCDCWGIEHQSYPKERFLDRDRIRYLTGELRNFEFPDKYFHLIILWHVLEHLEDIENSVDQLRGLLAPGGALIVAVPNFSSLEARRFKDKWFHLDLPWHHYHFSPKSLAYTMHNKGGRIVFSSTLSWEQGPFGLLQSVLNQIGFPKNELFEALKGNIKKPRRLQLFIQLVLFVILLMPACLVHIMTAWNGAGSVMEVVFKKDD